MMNSTTRTLLHSIWNAIYTPPYLNFAEALSELLGLGVVRYRVDYVAGTVTSYTSSFQAETCAIPKDIVECLVVGLWDGDRAIGLIKAAQEASKVNKGDAKEFSQMLVKAGVTDYTCYIEGRKVVYSGQLGESYSESLLLPETL
jgi:uncharacterized protein YbcV (DUF1398 family)